MDDRPVFKAPAPKPVKVSFGANITRMLQSPQALMDAEAVRALRASLLAMHEQVADKEQALERLAALHTRLLAAHEDLQKRVGEQSPGSRWGEPNTTPAVPPSPSAPGQKNQLAAAFDDPGTPDEPAWVTPAAQSEAWSDATSMRTPMNARTPGTIGVIAELKELKEQLAAATSRAERAEAKLAVTSARAEATAEEAAHRANRAEAELAVHLARSPSSTEASPPPAPGPLGASTPAHAAPAGAAKEGAAPAGAAEVDAAPAAATPVEQPAAEASTPSLRTPPDTVASFTTTPAEREAESRLLQERVAASVVAAAEADERAEAAEARAEAAEAALERLRSQLAASEAVLAEESAALRRENAALATQAAELEERMGATGTAGELEQRLAETEAEATTLRAANEELSSRTDAAEDALHAAKAEVSALRDAEEASKRRLAAEIWKLREEHQAEAARNEAALNAERARLKVLRASLYEAKGVNSQLLEERAAANALQSPPGTPLKDKSWDEV